MRSELRVLAISIHIGCLFHNKHCKRWDRKKYGEIILLHRWCWFSYHIDWLICTQAYILYSPVSIFGIRLSVQHSTVPNKRGLKNYSISENLDENEHAKQKQKYIMMKKKIMEINNLRRWISVWQCLESTWERQQNEQWAYIIECGCYSVVDDAFLSAAEKKRELSSFFLHNMWSGSDVFSSRFYFNGKMNKLKIINSYTWNPQHAHTWIVIKMKETWMKFKKTHARTHTHNHKHKTENHATIQQTNLSINVNMNKSNNWILFMFEFISWIITDYFIVWFLLHINIIIFSSLSSVQNLFGAPK